MFCGAVQAGDSSASRAAPRSLRDIETRCSLIERLQLRGEMGGGGGNWRGGGHRWLTGSRFNLCAVACSIPGYLTL